MRAAYDEAGASGHLLFRFDYRGNSRNVIFPFAAYFVTTRVGPGLLARLGSEVLQVRSLPTTEGGPSESELRHSVEDRFLGVVNESLGDHFSSCNLEVSTSTPDNFGYMVERSAGAPGGRASRTLRLGKSLSDADVIEMVKGLSGDNTGAVRSGHQPEHQARLERRPGGSGYIPLRGTRSGRRGRPGFWTASSKSFRTARSSYRRTTR